MRGAVRLAALMQVPVTYVWTHDSIGLGEDGPTHQPVEHLPALRAIPGLSSCAPPTRTRPPWRGGRSSSTAGPGRAGPHPAERARPSTGDVYALGRRASHAAAYVLAEAPLGHAAT